MSARTTRTLNPLPFQDLEPHRFEDLVRQLAYEFRDWVTLEAIGRSGADEGVDIRGVERVIGSRTVVDDDLVDVAEELDAPVGPERTWLFQCKREKSMPPSAVRAAIAATLGTSTPPHGFVLAAACDLSKKARDAFRAEMVRRGVKEFHVWARGELEDLLFQAANDRLLFAYFGVSLQPRKRSLATTLRSTIALKKQLARLLEAIDGVSERGVLLRDPTDDRYPEYPTQRDSGRGRWIARRALHLRIPGHLAILDGVHPAWIGSDGRTWDFVPECNSASMHAGLPDDAWGRSDDSAEPEATEEVRSRAMAFWHEYVDDSDKVWLHVQRLVPFERIVAIDPLGDGYYPLPHILLEFDLDDGPFTDSLTVWFEPLHGRGLRSRLRPSDSSRVQLFPREFPSSLYPPLVQFDPASSVVPGTLSEGALSERSKSLLNCPSSAMRWQRRE